MNKGDTIWDPWGERWVDEIEWAVALHRRILLSRTYRYRLGRMVELLLRRPVRPDTNYLRHWRDAFSMSASPRRVPPRSHQA